MLHYLKICNFQLNQILTVNPFEFIDFRITDALDILLVALLLYNVYRIVKGTVAINIFLGLVIVWTFWNVTKLLEMKMISSLVGGFMQVGFIVLVVVFQQEIRKFLLVLGSGKFSTKTMSRFFRFYGNKPVEPEINVEALITACKHLSQQRLGALIVIERNSSLEFLKASGDRMNIEINAPILESIFYKNSPLHDGAAIIQGNRITATRVILPVSNASDIPAHYGLRHKAALGITENTDAICLVVSEERGEIAYVRNRSFINFDSEQVLAAKIKRDLAS